MCQYLYTYTAHRDGRHRDSTVGEFGSEHEVVNLSVASMTG
jgi:hypothetical protein